MPRVFPIFFLAAAVLVASGTVRADGPGRIYTEPQAADTGAITGKVTGAKLTHALAMEHDRTRVFRAQLGDSDTSFRFEHLPVGRYDLVLVTTDGRVIEGLELGEEKKLSDESNKLLAERVAKAEKFFNRHQVHRLGFGDEDRCYVFVERLRDQTVLRGSGENLGSYLRRLEVIELQQATDDWQMLKTRHLFREEIPISNNIPFLKHRHLPALGGLRVADSTRDAGTIDLTQP